MKPFVKAVALGLVVPVFLEHRPHLDVALFAGEPVATMPFNLMSTVTANIMPPLFGDDFIIVRLPK